MSRSIAIHSLETFVTAATRSTGVSPGHSEILARALVTTDAMGVFTHGTKLLAGYLKKLQANGYDPVAQPTIEREGPGWAVINGNGALGQIGCSQALDIAMKKARNVGVAYVGLRNVGHIGAAGYFASLAAQHGFIAMITGNDLPSVAAPGSRTAVLGSNPLAYAVPVPEGDTIFLDIATAAVAGGKVYAAVTRGERIPDTWLIGPDGRPTSDGSLYPQHASLAPMAGHKGYGLGLWCEILSGVLPGGHVTWEVGSWIFDPPTQPSWHNASLQLIDVRAIADEKTYRQKLATIIGEIHRAPTAEGIEQVLLPGEREWNQLRAAQQHGILLPDDVRAKLKEAQQLTSVAFPELD